MNMKKRAPAVLINSSIINNLSGGLYNERGQYRPNIGSAFWVCSGEPVIVNCIIQGYSPIHQLNIYHDEYYDEDPMFVDSASGDYRLLPGSPCIDAGTSTYAPAYDILGRPRPVDVPCIGIEGPDAYDIGAYEYQLPLSTAPPHWILYGSR